MKSDTKPIEPHDFARFLAWLHPDRASAASLYNDLQRRLTTYFLGRGCGTWAGELASQTLDRTAEKFSDGGEIENREPGKYIFQVARFILLEHLRKPRSAPLVHDIGVQAAATQEDPSVRCCSECLALLSGEDRQVLQDYYQGVKRGESKRIRREVACELSVPGATLRVKVFRLKQRLTKCVTTCVQRGTAALA